MVKTLNDDGLSLVKLIQLSRDDPNLMKSVHSKLEAVTRKAWNPILLQGPCSIHPAHTAFKTGLAMLSEKLDLDIASLMRKLHTWFKVSPACREDMMVLYVFYEEFEGFYLRLVDSRWLCMEPVLERFLEHINSMKEYFLNCLPNSTDQSNKEAVMTESYKAIVSFLKPASVAKTVC